MKFQITEGLDLVSIRLSEIGSYFHFKRPLTAAWYDCGGSAGKYLFHLPDENGNKIEIQNKILESINIDFTENIQELKNLLDPILKTFKNGDYSLSYNNSSSSKFFDNYSSSSDVIVFTPLQYNWTIKFFEPRNTPDQESINQDIEIFYNDKNSKSENYWGQLFGSTLDGFYVGRSILFIATQPKTKIDQDRVKYFESQIEKGERPFAIIFNSSTDSFDSEHFILDGHHKLLAYQNLKITPSIVNITHLPKSREDLDFNIEDLMENLYPWHVDNILKNWRKKEEYILELLKNPESKIHKFIKNGHHKEYYKNGVLKHEAFYINSKIEGEANWWYENGNLEKTENYQKGLNAGEWKSWYESGNINSIHRFNEYGQYDGHFICYHDNGNPQWEQNLKNGTNIDGYSSLRWYENGVKSEEAKYLNGRMIECKNYTSLGELNKIYAYDFDLKDYVTKHFQTSSWK